MFLADEFLAKSEPLNVSESDEVSFKFEHEIITSNIKQVESNPNNFFIVFLLQSGSISRPYNNELNRTGLEPVSALNFLLCLVTTKIYLLAAAPTAAYNQLTCRFLYYYTYDKAFASSRKLSYHLLTMV